MKQFLLALSLILFAGAGAYLFYQSRQKQDVPPLLDRKGALSLTSEWKNTKLAITSLQDKIRKNPADYTSKLLLVYGYMQEARVTGEHPYYYPAAMQMVDNILANTKPKDPVYAKALIAKASVELSLHHFAEALETGTKALEVAPNDKDLYGVLCDANVELGHYDKAIEMADKMVAIRPELQSYSRVSYLREIHGDLPGAIEAMKLAVGAGYPGLEQTCWTRHNLAKLYEKAGDTSMARQLHEVNLLQYKNYPFALGGIAALYAKAGQYDKALTVYAKALEIMPEFSFQEEMARIYVTTKNPKAPEAIKATIAMLKEDEEAGHDADLELANLHLTLDKDLESAYRYAERAHKKRPDNLDVNRAMALVLAAQGKKEEAKKYATTALRTHKPDPDLARLIASK
jgi:tetratricopeptide (TPR) repeat protein